mmetsp:Transcript_50007/g.113773  ORF Transcript_50007/g.113773 Transcript_50007/m.113773 type:complete len:222 (+) Transcript_50007:870-1535(+)
MISGRCRRHGRTTPWSAPRRHRGLLLLRHRSLLLWGPLMRPLRPIGLETLVAILGGSLCRWLHQHLVHHSPLLLRKEVIRGRHVVVLVRLQALHRVLSREAIAVELLQDLLVQCANVVAILKGSLGHLPVPPVLPDVCQGHALLWLCGQHAGDEIGYLCAHEVRHLVLCIEDLLVKLCVVLVLKGQVATDKSEEDDTAAPDVDHAWHVLLPRDHLRGGVAR